MEKITVKFLGTASAIPTKKRNHSSILLTYKNENILIDCGEGTQRQFKIANISPTKLTKILLTHWHGDHVLGLPGLFQTLVMSEYQKELDIYGPKKTKENIEALKRLFRITLKTKEYEAKKKMFENEEYYIESSPMSHGIPSLAYSFVIKDKLRIDKKKLSKLKLPNSPELKKLQQGKDITIDGKKIKAKDLTYLEKGRKITIILDTEFNQNAINLAKDSDILITESSFTEKEIDQAREYKHLTAKQAATIAKKAKAKKLILTHISQRYNANPKVVLDEAKKVFKNTKVANDFDSIQI